VERADGTVEDLGGCAETMMRPGDVLVIETPGGGGYGIARTPGAEAAEAFLFRFHFIASSARQAGQSMALAFV